MREFKKRTAKTGPAKTRPAMTLSFVGPIAWEGGRTRHEPCYFLLLQSTGQALKLEYANHAGAISARRQLNTGKDTHFVPSMKLLQAIQQALQLAQPPAGPTIPDEEAQTVETTVG